MLIAGAFRRSANDRGFASFCQVASERLEFLTTEKHEVEAHLRFFLSCATMLSICLM
jgi:hypothetical protein